MRRVKELGMLSERGNLGSHMVITGFLKRESSKGEDAYLKWLKLGINTFLSAAARGGLALRCDAVQAGALRAKGLGGDHGAEPVRSEH